MKKLLISGAICVALLGACASLTAKTPAQRVYALQADFNAPLAVAVAYESQPRCAENQSQLSGCSDAKVVAILRKGYLDAAAALKAAQDTVRTPGVEDSKITLAIAAATNAITAFKTIVETHNLK